MQSPSLGSMWDPDPWVSSALEYLASDVALWQARKITRNRSLAEDACAETLARAWARRATLTRAGEASTHDTGVPYARQMLENVCLQLLHGEAKERKTQQRLQAEATVVPIAAGPANEGDGNGDRPLVDRLHEARDQITRRLDADWATEAIERSVPRGGSRSVDIQALRDMVSSLVLGWEPSLLPTIAAVGRGGDVLLVRREIRRVLRQTSAVVDRAPRGHDGGISGRRRQQLNRTLVPTAALVFQELVHEDADTDCHRMLAADLLVYEALAAAVQIREPARRTAQQIEARAEAGGWQLPPRRRPRGKSA